jgi:hypothetical protein
MAAHRLKRAGACSARDIATRLALLAPLVRRLRQAGAGERARALAAHAQAMADDLRDPHLLAALVEVLAGAGEHDQAIDLVRSGDGERFALPALVRTLALAGEIEEAAAALDSFTGSAHLRDAIAALAEVTGAETAYPLLGKIGQAEERALAMIAFAKHADPALGRRLLAEAAGLAHWTGPLTALAREDHA